MNLSRALLAKTPEICGFLAMVTVTVLVWREALRRDRAELLAAAAIRTADTVKEYQR